MEASRHKMFRVVSSLSLSIAALLFVVNAHGQSLTGINSSKSAKKSKNDFHQLVQLLLERGNNGKIGNNLAPVIGLEKASEVKQQDIVIKMTEQSADLRSCFVVFANDDQKTPMCLFMKRAKQTLSTTDSKYFRVSLAGKLERAVGLQGKRTAEQAIRGSGVTTEQDIESPEVKKEFDVEMAYWLKEWLKKESKTPSKAASAAPTGPKTASL